MARGEDKCKCCGEWFAFHTMYEADVDGYSVIYRCPHKGGYVTDDQFERAEPNDPVSIPADGPATRKDTPLFSGCLAYFPDALLTVSRLSKIGNDKHNPGQPLHWSKDKSADHADCLARHLIDHGRTDPDTGLSHTVAVAWRALALLQIEIETSGKAGLSIT